MKRILLAIAVPAAGLLLTLSPGWAATYEERFDTGVAARREGRPAEAVAVFQQLEAEDPRNTDVLVQLGFSQLAANNLDLARESFERALAIAPDYRDANLGLAQVAVRRGELDMAEQQAGIVLASRTDAEAQAVLTQVAAARNEDSDREATAFRWRVDADGTFSNLTGPAEDWREGTLRMGYQLTPATRVSAALELSKRFNLFDAYVEGRIDHRFSEQISAYAFFGGTPDADFRPELAFGGGAEAALLNPGGVLSSTALSLGGYVRHYPDAQVIGVSPGLVQYLFDGRAWVTAYWINVLAEEGGHDDGYSMRADVQASDALRLFAGWSDAPDPEDGDSVRTRSLFAGASLDITEHVTIRGSYAHEDRSAGYDRSVFSAGVGVRF